MSAPTATLPPFATEDRYLATVPGPPPADLAALLTEASTYIRRFCGWHVAPVLTDDLLVVDGSGGWVQLLPTLRLLGVSAVENAGNLLDVDTVEWSTDGYLRAPGFRGWTGRLRGVQATVTHGWNLDEVGELAALCVSMAARAAAGPTGPGVLSQETVGGTSVVYGGMAAEYRPGSVSLLGYEKETLYPFRLPGRRAG